MTIAPRPHSDPKRPSLRWLIEYTDPSGKRRRKFFRSKREAQLFASNLQSEARGAGLEAARLSPAERRAHVEALEKLKPYGVGLLDVVNAYVAGREREAALQHRPIGELVEEFIGALATSNLRPSTIDSLTSELGHFCRFVGEDQPVAHVGEEDCRRYVFAAGASPRTSTNRRLRLSRFFRWTLKQGHVLANPVEAVERPRNEAPRPSILSPKQARALVEAAAELAGGKWLPYVACCLFAGLRPQAECERLDWSDVDLAARTIVVRSGKLRQRRVVEIPANAVQWLAPYARQSGPVAPEKKRSSTTLKAVREHAGIHEWQADVLRHSALTYRLALTGDEARVAQWGGNSPGTLHRHYRALATGEQAREFFDIVPDGSGELIRFGSAGEEAEAQA